MSFRFAEYLIPKKLKVAPDHGRLLVRAGGREGARRGLRAEPGVGRDQADRPGLGAGSRRRRCSAPAAPARPRFSSGPSRRRSQACSRRRARRAGTSRSTRRRPARTRSCASSSRTIRTGWTGSRSRPAGRRPRSAPGPFLSFQRDLEKRFGVQLVGVKTPDGARGRPAARLRDVLVRLRERARGGDPARRRRRRTGRRSWTRSTR